MSDTVYYREKDFNKLDWSRLKQGKYKASGENYNFGKGGVHFVNGSGYQLSIFTEDGEIMEVWELPTVLSRFIEKELENGREEKMNEIKRVLGL